MRSGLIGAVMSTTRRPCTRTAAVLPQAAAAMLDAGGLLFVRVNAADTDVGHSHRITERSGGGFTILYEGGPKSGLHVHFFSRGELEAAVTGSGLRMTRPPRMVTTKRPEGAPGSWSQWELVAAREG